MFIDDSKLSLASTTTVKSNRRNISGSMQSLRDAVHRIPHPHISSSRTSLTSEKNRKVEITKSSTIDVQDTISLKVPDISSMYCLFRCIRRGLVVRISAFHAGGPGSIPGVGILFFCV